MRILFPYFRFAVCLTFGVVHLGTCLADDFYLLNGSVVHGKWIKKSPDLSASNRPVQFLIETDPGILVIVDADQVKKLEEESDAPKRAYLEKLKSLDDSAEKHREMVNWADQSSLGQIAQAHRERVVELDPKDNSMWRKLGYDLDSHNNWVRKEILAWRSGLLMSADFDGKRRGFPRPRSPQDIEIERNQDDEAKKQAKAKDVVNLAFKDIDAGNKRAPEKLVLLKQLNDPFSLNALIETLSTLRAKNLNVERRLFLIDLISKFKNSASVSALSQSAIGDPELRVVEKAIGYLKEYGQDRLVADCMIRLRSNAAKQRASMSEGEINHLGWILSQIPDDRALKPLIDNLKTTRDVSVGNGNAQNFSSSGSTTFGNLPPKPVTVLQKNILQALKAQSNGKDFGYEKQLWLEWYAETHASTGLNLRRDP